MPYTCSSDVLSAEDKVARWGERNGLPPAEGGAGRAAGGGGGVGRAGAVRGTTPPTFGCVCGDSDGPPLFSGTIGLLRVGDGVGETVGNGCPLR